MKFIVNIVKENCCMCFLLLGAWVYSNGQPEPKPGETVIFSTAISGDATPAVLARMLLAPEKPISQIKFEKGTYHFYPDKGLEEYCHISNHDDGLVRTALPILNFSDLTIDGQGSIFVFHGRMVPFLIEGSRHITVQNVSIDWAQPFHSEGTIIANNPSKGTFDMEISEEYPYEIRNGQLIFVKEYYYEHTLGQTILYDPNRRAIAFNTEAYTPLTSRRKTAVQNNIDKSVQKYKDNFRSKDTAPLGFENELRAEQIRPGVVRIYGHRKKLPSVGMVLVSKGEQRANRIAPAFRITDTSDFNALNVNVHHAGGMGLIAENSANLILNNFNVTPSHGRMVSTTADATHFVGCSGKVILKNCTFDNQLDDASNIHGAYQQVVDLLDNCSIGVRMGHYQQQGFAIGKAGDTIGLVRLEDSFFSYHKLTLKSIHKINGRYQIVTFNQELPETLKEGDLIENLVSYPEVLIENCNISNNRARGLLISTPKKTIIKDNFFSTEMEAILVPVESGSWFESGSASNLTIVNNVFQDCQHSGFDRGVIRFVTDDDNANIAFKNIKIDKNRFDQFDNLILEISNVDHLEFIGNTITNSGNFPKLYPKNPAIRVKFSKNVIFKNNKYFGDAKVILESHESTPKPIFK